MTSTSAAPPPQDTIPTMKSTSGEVSSSSAPMPQVTIPTMKSTAGEASSSSAQPPPLPRKILTLKSSDDDEFEVEECIAVQSGTIKNMVEDGYNVIPLLNVDSKTLIKILDYMMKHAEKSGATEEQLKEFDNEFVKVSFTNLSALVFAANYLHITGLMSLLCQTIADKIKNKSIGAVRRIFDIANDYTAEEEDEVRREYEWAHEGEFDDTVEDEYDVPEEEDESDDDDEDDNDGKSEEEKEEGGGKNAGEIEEVVE